MRTQTHPLTYTQTGTLTAGLGQGSAMCNSFASPVSSVYLSVSVDTASALLLIRCHAAFAVASFQLLLLLLLHQQQEWEGKEGREEVVTIAQNKQAAPISAAACVACVWLLLLHLLIC